MGTVVFRNKTARSDQTVHECINLLLEDAILHSEHPTVPWMLVEVLLIHGSIKHVFLALKYCTDTPTHSSRVNQAVQDKIKNNLTEKAEKDR